MQKCFLYLTETKKKQSTYVTKNHNILILTELNYQYNSNHNMNFGRLTRVHIKYTYEDKQFLLNFHKSPDIPNNSIDWKWKTTEVEENGLMCILN